MEKKIESGTDGGAVWIISAYIGHAPTAGLLETVKPEGGTAARAGDSSVVALVQHVQGRS